MKSIDESSSIKQFHNVRVKLTGDGTYIGSRQHIVSFGFTLLDDQLDLQMEIIWFVFLEQLKTMKGCQSVCSM